MDISSILNNVLNTGQQLNQNAQGSLNGSNLGDTLKNMLGGAGAQQSGGIGGMLGNMLGGTQGSQGGGIGDMLGSVLGNPDMMKKIGGGAAAAGVLSMLLGGSKGNRSISGSIAKMGSLAAVGTLAYKAYQSWQQNSASTAAKNAPQAILPSAERSADETEQNSRTVLKAMIAAAHADGEIDQAEQAAILQQVGQESQEVQQWLTGIINNPPGVVEIAREVGQDPALAAEVYLTSRIVCGDLDRKEIVYLGKLQEALGMDDDLVAQLEKQAGF